ncbi:MAG: Polyketide cyclase / dehydrase and lipid transport [Marmoricola sp.]|nr:Polyketide cyclase / dehydrase and lipid transport [Marmoricola sp.]
MNRFSASNRSSATLQSSRADVWKALTDPELLPRLTPYLQRIDVAGDRWTWHVTRIPILGKSIGSTFTEVMTFEEPSHIEYHHDPERTEEQTEVEGSYDLADEGSGCRVSIDLTVTVELPFPRAMRKPVEGTMSTVMAGMGKVFARNLLRHLGER